MAKYNLNQKVELMYQNCIIPSIITKRIRVENLDTEDVEFYYDYVHDFKGGYNFTQVPEEHLIMLQRQVAIKKTEELNEKHRRLWNY